MSSFTKLFGAILLGAFLLACPAFCDEPLEELKVETTQEGDCTRKAAKGDLLSMHYTGSLIKDGSVFDSSVGRGEPFKFQLGVGQVIKGWDQGLLGVCLNEKRVLLIPSALAYGEQGAGDKIPPGSDLKFEVECTSIEDGPPAADVFGEIDTDGDKQLSREEVSAYLKKQIPEGAEGSEGMPEQDKLVEEIFQHEDHDKNGLISHTEFSGPKHDEL